MSDAYDYGNARIAARRSMLLTPELLERLAEAGTPAAAAALLERLPAWRRALQAARSSTTDGHALLLAAIEHERTAELAALPRWYAGDARRLVEALVLPLDRDRVVAILRRRRAGQTVEAINPTIVGGAVLDGRQLADIAREPTTAGTVQSLRRRGLIAGPNASYLAILVRRGEPVDESEVETAFVGAWEAARAARISGHGPDADRVRALLAAEDRDRQAVAEELGSGGAAGAALVERSLLFTRATRLIRAARRDPDGIGAVAAYVAAVEAQAVRLRVVVNRLAAGWSRRVAVGYLGEAVA